MSSSDTGALSTDGRGHRSNPHFNLT